MTTGTSAITRLLNDTRSRSLFFQFLLLAGIVLGLWWIVDNTVTNLGQQNKSVGFGFLFQTAGFQINTTLGTWMFDYKVGSSTYLDVYYIGIVNTFIVAFFGIFAATFLGFLLGIMRLSQNFVLRIFATSYIEVVRNVPLLLQLFFWYFAVLRTMPNKRGKIEIIPDVIGVNITGLYMPAPIPAEGFAATGYAFLIAVLITIGINQFASRRQLATGKTFPTFWAGLGVLVLLPYIVFKLTGSPLGWEFPEFKETGAVLRRGYQQGDRSLAGTRAEAEPCPSACHHPAGDADHHSAAYVAISQPHEEFVACGGHRLSRARVDLRRHRAEPGRSGNRDGVHDDERLSDLLDHHLGVHELVQRARQTHRAIAWLKRRKMPRPIRAS